MMYKQIHEPREMRISGPASCGSSIQSGETGRLLSSWESNTLADSLYTSIFSKDNTNISDE